MDFLPMTPAECGHNEVDFVFVSGDAYVDHPSFANALIGRWLHHNGYTVGMLAQPDWRTAEDFKRFGRPKLGFLVSAGNLDSMVNLYTASKHRRKKDEYAPGGKTGMRPQRASIVFCNRIREAYGNIPIILGGVEASLRRFAHYDYWSDSVRQSILSDSGADILVYGMGENAILQIAEALSAGLPPEHITFVNGTCYTAKNLSLVYEYSETPSFEEVSHSKFAYCDAFVLQMDNSVSPLVQKQQDLYIVQNPPTEPLTTKQMDSVYAMDFQRLPHPSYQESVPALEEVLFSITSQRGCLGGCSFCSIYYHQGKSIQKRSEDNIVEEAKKMTQHKSFKGYIHDVGGPTANFYDAACTNPGGTCSKRRCLTPQKCRYCKVSHQGYLHLLKRLGNIEGVKKVFIRSGIRYDYALMDSDEFIRQLVRCHVSGQLKIAPEHVSPEVLKWMGKPKIEIYEQFVNKFTQLTKRLNMKQYVLPYFMSSHPGCTLKEAVVLAEYIRDTGFMPDQVQDFYPTPGTISTCMYYTEMDPYTQKKVYVAKTAREKEMQRALMQYSRPQNKKIVLEALKQAGREDLIGKEKRCLIHE